MSELMNKLKKAGTVDVSSVLKDSVYFMTKETIHTDLPILNIAFSGDIDGGMTSGVTIFAGESRTFKSYCGIYCMKAYMDKYPDSIALFYDSEFGIPVSYMESLGIDLERIIHIPITTVDELKNDMANRLKEINRGDKVFIMVDSLGNLASTREYNNAINENESKDMSRAADIKSFFRVCTTHICMKDIPCIIISHTYKEMSMYPKSIIGGGTGIIYSANQAFIISKSQNKEGSELSGWTFTLNVEKSRFVREKSKLSFTVNYDSGLMKYSGLDELIVEAGILAKPSQGWYAVIDQDTGEMGPKCRLKEILTPEFYEKVLASEKFKQFVSNKYKLGNIKQEISLNE